MTNQLPAHLQSKTYAPIADRAIANIGQAAPPSLSIEGNRFTLIDAVGNEMPIQTLFLDTNIVDVGDHTSKIYYDTDYAGKGQAMGPPPCWSDNGIGPSRNASSPQAPTCAACPKNEWGSATSKMTGKGIKACRDYEKIAIAPVGMNMVFLLRLPPNSRNNWRDYLKKFQSGGADVSDVITRVEFEPGMQGTLLFSATEYLSVEGAEFRNKLRGEKATDDIVGRLDQPRSVALPAPETSQNPGLVATQNPAPNTTGFGAAAQPLPAQPLAPPQIAGFQPNPPVAEPQKRRRRTAAEAAPAADPRQIDAFPANHPAPAATAGFAPQGAPTAPFRAAAPAAGQANTFGIQAGVTPNAEVTAALDGIFKK